MPPGARPPDQPWSRTVQSLPKRRPHKGEVPPGRGIKNGVIAVLRKESHTPGHADDYCRQCLLVLLRQKKFELRSALGSMITPPGKTRFRAAVRARPTSAPAHCTRRRPLQRRCGHMLTFTGDKPFVSAACDRCHSCPHPWLAVPPCGPIVHIVNIYLDFPRRLIYAAINGAIGGVAWSPPGSACRT